MNDRQFLRQVWVFAIFAFLASGLLCQSFGAGSVSKPNIIFFLVDDMGWQDTSEPFHTETTALNQRYSTPNMELLADAGMKFTPAYACAVCSPTRLLIVFIPP